MRGEAQEREEMDEADRLRGINARAERMAWAREVLANTTIGKENVKTKPVKEQKVSDSIV